MTQATATQALTTKTHYDVQATAAPPVASSRRIYNPIQKDAVTFQETAEESSSAHTTLDMEVAPGGGNILHIHTTFAERFTALSGELGVQIGTDTYVLKPGQSAVAPAGSLHRWYNPSRESVTVRVELRPGNSGFERSLRIAYGLACDGQATAQGLPKNLLHLALLGEMSDTYVPGLFAMIAPLLRLLARWARHKGIERDLLERYCR